MSNKEVYRKLCDEQQLPVPVFMQPWWLDAVCGTWDVALARKGEHITGAWAYPIEKKWGVTLLRNPVLTPYLGPHVFYPHNIKEKNEDSFQHEAVSELMKQLPEAQVWQLALSPGMKQAGIFKSYKLQPLVQQTFLVELDADEQTLFANMKDAVKKIILKSEKELTISNEPGLLPQLYQLHKTGQKGSARPYTIQDLQRIMDAGLANNATALWVARRGDEIAGMVWHVWDAAGSYYLMDAQHAATDNKAAIALLLWHTIKEAKRMGHATLNLEGSADQGVEQFFRSFGGERALYMVLEKNDSLLWKMRQVFYK